MGIDIDGTAAMTAAQADAPGMRATRTPAGCLSDGTPIDAITLSNNNGISARILTFGATLQALIMPDITGKLADIILGHDDVAGYETTRGFLGVIVGRYANRIAHGRFTLDGVSYNLPRNDGPNTLHGGDQGFDQAIWTVISVTSEATASVRLQLVSPDGHNGFPGEVVATVTYTLDDPGDLTMTFEATSTKPTIINMTNHALFNLAGDGAPQGAMLHRLSIPAARYTPVDQGQIPTGELRPVDQTVFDFRNGRIVADGLRHGGDEQIAIGRGYDHNFVLDKGLTDEPQLAARLEESSSGRRVDVLSTEPGLQLYTGNALGGRIQGKHNRLYRMGDGIALEPQKFPDTPNRPGFGSARVDRDHPYRHVMVYRLSVRR